MMRILAYDGGATATRAGLYDSQRALLAEAIGGPCNPVEYGADHCVATLVSLARKLTSERVGVVVGGISGAGRGHAQRQLAKGLLDGLRPQRVLVSNDLYPALFANAGTGPAVLVIAGTGSSVLAQGADGRAIIIGGRGAVFGDEGSAYQIAVCGLRAAGHAVDGTGPNTSLVEELAAAAGVDTFDGLVPWTAEATKQQVAALAETVDVAALRGDRVARECIATQAERLAAQTLSATQRLDLPGDTRVYINGGVFERSRLFRDTYDAALAESLPGVQVRFPPLQGHRAVLELALAGDALPEWVCDLHLGAS